MALSGEGEYNLDILKEIEVTDSFNELDNEIRKCQSFKSKETYDNCTTRYFMEEMRLKCGCLPFAIVHAMNNKKVSGKLSSSHSTLLSKSPTSPFNSSM